jgi:hypothetical protein
MPEEKISRWTTSISGDLSASGEKIAIMRQGWLPRIYLEIDAPGFQSAGADQRQLGREVIQTALDALQAALDSPTELAVFHADRK